MNYPVHTFGLVEFITESNMIEGINRRPTAREIEAAERFLQTREPTPCDLGDAQAVFAPGKPLRTNAGMNVYVGNYTAPPGGPNIVKSSRQDFVERQSGIKFAKMNGAAGGKKAAANRQDKRAPKDKALRIWKDLSIATNAEAVDKINSLGYSEPWLPGALYNQFGKSGRPTGRRSD